MRFGLEILYSSNFGISGNNVKKSLIWDDSDMAGVFVKKSICVLIVGGGFGGKTRLFEVVVLVQKICW